MNIFTIPYNPKPDYTRPQFKLDADAQQRLRDRLCKLYGTAAADQWMPELERILQVHWAHKPPELIEAEKSFDIENRFTEQDSILITYGDLLLGEEACPLETLANFFQTVPRFKDFINTLHILPFFPYSSDRGFSVRDFRTVDPKLGSWQDIELLNQNFQLMFDAVFNHISAASEAFQEMLNDNPLYQDTFTVYHSPDELTPEQRALIVRPRTSDVLTEFQSINGPIWVWTTFSPDQIDLNFRNPRVLLYVLETLLIYVRYGADVIRLDAVTYLWEEPGTTCASLEQTHEVVKLFRDVLQVTAPAVAVITETNVPHAENISYFGDGTDEAQMVYNFALPPLVLHTFYRENTTALNQWAASLDYPSSTTTFFNILDTHDGIGLMGVKNILPPEEIAFLIQTARQHGAFISYKTGPSGQDEPYEMNTTWFSALNLDNSGEDLTLQVKRYVASRAIALVLKGVPGIYFHGLVGTSNDVAKVLQTKVKRDINRPALVAQELIESSQAPTSKAGQIMHRFGNLLFLRKQYAAFHPNGSQRLLSLTPEVFAVLRSSPAEDQHILAITNVTPREVALTLALTDLDCLETQWYDLVKQRGWLAQNNTLVMNLRPYDVVWLMPFAELERMVSG
ncbi:MAG: sugar phosphorylase [Cyanobacteria bacterium J06626_18]